MATSTPNYDVNYDDKRFTQVETDKQAALSEVEKTYGGMVDNVDKFYQAQIDASNQWADKQSQLQQERTDFAIEQINQQKDQAKKDYTKEQSGAYVDWQKQSNQYGVNAEKMAGSGLTNTGFSESSQVAMYNTYQNRVATAREVYNRAILNYDNAIKDAQLQNNSALAEIAYNALQKGLELSLEGFQYKNTLLIEQANKKQEIDNTYYNRYQDVLNQINTENAMAEDVRQWNENMAFKEKEYAEGIRQWNESMALKEKEYEEGIRQFNEEIARLKAQDEADNAYRISQLELQRDELQHQKDKLAEEKRQYDESLAEEKRQFDAINGTAPLDTGIVSYDETNLASLGITSADQYFYMLDNGLIEEYREGDKIYARRTTSTTNRNNQTSSADLGNAALQAFKQKTKAELYTYRWD